MAGLTMAAHAQNYVTGSGNDWWKHLEDPTPAPVQVQGYSDAEKAFNANWMKIAKAKGWISKNDHWSDVSQEQRERVHAWFLEAQAHKQDALDSYNRFNHTHYKSLDEIPEE
jgi:hypothetical protein